MSFFAYSAFLTCDMSSDFSLKYASIDDAVAYCNKFLESPPFLAKLDLQDAFKFIRIHPGDWHLMGFSWLDGGAALNFISLEFLASAYDPHQPYLIFLPQHFTGL